MDNSQAFIRYDGLSFPVLPDFRYSQDGPNKAGEEFFFLEKPEQFTITFDNIMGLMDKQPEQRNRSFRECSQESGGKRLHLLYPIPDVSSAAGNFGFFHLELPDGKGGVRCCPGQILSSLPAAFWTDTAIRSCWMGFRSRRRTADNQHSQLIPPAQAGRKMNLSGVRR